MSVPSFARPTMSSTLKASSRSAQYNDATESGVNQRTDIPGHKSTMARKLKRPSMLTSQDRKNIARNADLYHIRPADRLKPCPLATLPTELREIIYSNVFGDFHRPVLMNYRRGSQSPSALLQICRAIRIEAAYMYYTRTSFFWVVKNLNFSMIMRWLSNLQPNHRALLSRNRSMTIEIIPRLQKSYTYPPKEFLLDATMQDHWKACQPFGNLYAIVTQSGRHDHIRVGFILFCRLAAWSKLCSRASYTDIQWNYCFDMPPDRHGMQELYDSTGRGCRHLRALLERQLGQLWTRNRCIDTIRRPILELYDAFVEVYTEMMKDVTNPHDNTVPRLIELRHLIETWGK